MPYTLIVIMLCTTLLSICCGIMGTFIILQKQSLLADAISHAALAGITVAFIIVPQANSGILLTGAIASSILATICLQLISRYTRLKYDTALGIVLSGFFGCGLALISVIQKMGVGQHAILHKFLFGNVTTLLASDLWIIGFVSTLVSIICLALWKEFNVLAFDPSYASILIPTRLLHLTITALTLITIIAGIQLVGVILMSALLIAPAACARQLAHRLKPMVFLAICCATVACNSAVILSNSIAHLPTGPTIVVLVSMCALGSLAINRK